MKALRLLSYIGIASLFLTTGCQKLSDINVDPNSPSKVTTGLLLSAAEANYAYTQGGDLSRYTSVWTQQLKGVDRQFVAVDEYAVTEVDMDNAWRFGLYGGAMQDFHQVINQGEAEGNPYYAGIGKTMMAYALLTCTDLFGDVPYTEAFQGVDNFQPKFDTQADVYTAIRALLASARTDFGKPSTDNAKLPSAGDDFIFAGNVAKWTAFTHGIEARTWLHVQKRDNTAAAKALASVASARTGWADAEFGFGETPTTANPWYQFSSQRSGYIGFEGFLADTMTGLVDPRAAIYANAMKETPSGPYGASDAAIVLMSSYELDFIEAEAKLAGGDLAGAKTAYLAGVEGALDYAGVDAAAQTAYLANTTVNPAGDVSLGHIMFQKYIALYTQPEAFTDWRRTGLPALAPIAGTAIPRRFLYPQSENLYNPNTPSGQSLFSRVWWDVQ